ncbi:MAG: WG repeat-containing protein [Prevotella sp.]|nr:WG repeat-containing protein [Prevotella sp.]
MKKLFSCSKDTPEHETKASEHETKASEHETKASEHETKASEALPKKKSHIKKKSYHEGLAAISMKEGNDSHSKTVWGFVDKSNNFVIHPQYRAVTRFFQGVAVVCNDREWTVIDRNGNPVSLEQSPKKITVAFPTSMHGILDDGVNFLFDIESKEWWEPVDTNYIFRELDGYVDSIFGLAYCSSQTKTNEQEKDDTEPYMLKDTMEFSEGLAAIQGTSGRWGFKDERGHIVVNPIYLSVSQFYHGISLVFDGSSWKVIDKTGKVLRGKYIGTSDDEWENHVIEYEQGRLEHVATEERDPDRYYTDENFIFNTGEKIWLKSGRLFCDTDDFHKGYICIK